MLVWTSVFKFLCRHVFSFLLGKHLRAEPLSHKVTPCFNIFYKLPYSFPEWLHHFKISIAMYEVVLFFNRECIQIKQCLSLKKKNLWGTWWLRGLSICLFIPAQLIMSGSRDRAPRRTLRWLWSLPGILSLPGTLPPQCTLKKSFFIQKKDLLYYYCDETKWFEPTFFDSKILAPKTVKM